MNGQSLIRQMVAGGFLAPDPTVMAASPSPRRAMRSAAAKSPFQYRVEMRTPRQRKMRAAEASALREGGDPRLLATLKALRLRLARERQVPAYVIFSDRTLIDMAARRPRDLDAFAEVNGVGAAKLKDFGEVFLSAIAAHGRDGAV